MEAKMNRYKCWIPETRPDVLNGYYEDLLLECGFKIVNKQYHFFKPFGFTALYLLSESHFAIHTFPEKNTSYIELTSCVDAPFKQFVKKHTDGIKQDIRWEQ